MTRIKLSPGAVFVDRIEHYAKLRGGISRSRAVQELAILGMFTSGMLNEDGSYSDDYDPNNIQPVFQFRIIPMHGGARDGAGRKLENEK
jgi:hypothetical protein